jgi:translation initiation factor 2 beta subunit (eIF-2beta)/eIF-5
MINIAHSSARDDPFYRYKRSKVQLTQKVFKNFSTICTQLKTPEKQLRSFISKTLGCRMDDKNMLSSHVTVEQMERVIQTYVEKYVLCTKCNLPELNAEKICQACGSTQK